MSLMFSDMISIVGLILEVDVRVSTCQDDQENVYTNCYADTIMHSAYCSWSSSLVLSFMITSCKLGWTI